MKTHIYNVKIYLFQSLLLLIATLIVCTKDSLAQMDSRQMEHEMIIQFYYDPYMPDTIQPFWFIFNDDTIVGVGIPSIDTLNYKYDIIDFRRVYPSIEYLPPSAHFMCNTFVFISELIVNDTMIEIYNLDTNVNFSQYNFIYEICDGTQTRNSFPNDPYFPLQWGLHNDVSNLGWPDADKNAPEAWDINRFGLPVGIIDTGIDYEHEDLFSNICTNGEVQNDGVDDDLNGYIDDFYGYDWANEDPDPFDDNGHGTHVAGIVGALWNNSIGVAGEVPGCDEYPILMALKVLDSQGNGTSSDIVAAIEYAVDKDVKVINMSLITYLGDPALQQTVQLAYNNGCIIVAAMGNENLGLPAYPAAYSEVIAVGATDFNDERAINWPNNGGSNFGSHISVIAPGDSILSTVPGDNYEYYNGTSMATPFVSGIASLLVGYSGGTFTNDDVRLLIEHTADDEVGILTEDVNGKDPYYGYGRINEYSALAHAQDLLIGDGVKLLDNVRISSVLNPGFFPFGEPCDERLELVAVRPSHIFDVTLEILNDWGIPVAASVTPNDAVEFVQLYNRPWPGPGSDFSANVTHTEPYDTLKYAIEWVSVRGFLMYDDYLRSCPFFWESASVGEVFGIYLPEGNHEIDLRVLSGEFDPLIALYRLDQSSSFYADRSQALALADDNGPGAGESITYNVASNQAGWYSFVICSNNGRHGMYDLPCGSPVIAENMEAAASGFHLENISPNPFSTDIGISFTIYKEMNISITIFDLCGKKFKTLVDSRFYTGDNNVLWNGTDDQGNRLPDGLYICRIKSESKIEDFKLILIR
jgi:hypothetical protein